MAQLPVIKRLLTEDFPTESTWIGSLFYPLNLFFNGVYAALNNGITFKDNIMSQVNVLSVSGATPTISYPWKYSTNPIGVLIVNCYNTDGTRVVNTNPVSCDWSYSAGIITINNVAGLGSTHTYNITFISLGG